MECRVISVRGRKHAELLADPNFVYVGRRCYGWPESIWGNPFKPGMAFTEAAGIIDALPGVKVYGRPRGYLGPLRPLEFYYSWVLNQPSLVARLPELRGKTLGCWCGDWMPGRPDLGCHAVVLAKLVAANPSQGAGA